MALVARYWGNKALVTNQAWIVGGKDRKIHYIFGLKDYTFLLNN